jgi:16S rRNA C1402 (ribose-2'-O) methylase RsmI
LVRRATADELTLRGEFVIVLEAVTAGEAASRDAAAQSPAAMADGRAEVARLVAGGAKRSDAVRQVAFATGLDRRELYRPD